MSTLVHLFEIALYGVGALLFLYIGARTVTRAIIRSLKEEEKKIHGKE